MALATEIVGDRWTLLVLREAFYGVQRFDDMRVDLDVPRSMLSDRLRKLVESGLMTRQPYQEPGERVRYAYALTDAGRDLALTMLALTQWGEKYASASESPVEVVSGKSGRRLHVALVDEAGEIVPLEEARLALRTDPSR
ncbi:helix-turn-helix transcriptional regulator [Rhizobiales bacterium]|uniref:winged helix-turn-helix transcriptional regulator n=1 Tax=Hongsoonwoonella zoysiae TaxID=2821844 RepID=UPI0015611C7F|nr:helix-turn-helix domain-containing protein [Hongsoonwoonella zoysiae]NRG18585.1 helix-turn-helix transcriptional regulator [Hongsoonwoonella zoysiae]